MLRSVPGRDAARPAPAGAMSGLADDEAGALDRGQDLRLRLRPLECSRRTRSVVQVTDPAGMPSLDREDRTGCAEDLLRLDVAGLAEIGSNPGVFKHLRGCRELRHIGVCALEVELRRLHRRTSKRTLQERDVRGLVLGDDAGERSYLAAELAADRASVERRFEILERQCEIENRHVTRSNPGTRNR